MTYNFIKYFKYVRQSFSLYVVKYYKKDKLLQLWSGLIYPVCHPYDWDVPESISSTILNPLVIWTPAGRPKTKRIPSSRERKKRWQQVYSNCKQLAHNRVKCTNQVLLDDAFTSQGEPSQQHNVRKPRVCLVCRQPGYTWKTCTVTNFSPNEYEKHSSSFELEV